VPYTGGLRRASSRIFERSTGVAARRGVAAGRAPRSAHRGILKRSGPRWRLCRRGSGLTPARVRQPPPMVTRRAPCSTRCTAFMGNPAISATSACVLPVSTLAARNAAAKHNSGSGRRRGSWPRGMAATVVARRGAAILVALLVVLVVRGRARPATGRRARRLGVAFSQSAASPHEVHKRAPAANGGQWHNRRSAPDVTNSQRLPPRRATVPKPCVGSSNLPGGTASSQVRSQYHGE
jgi:hypothetical protein